MFVAFYSINKVQIPNVCNLADAVHRHRLHGADVTFDFNRVLLGRILKASSRGMPRRRYPSCGEIEYRQGRFPIDRQETSCDFKGIN